MRDEANKPAYALNNIQSSNSAAGSGVEICDQSFTRQFTVAGITTTVNLTHQFFCIGGICRGFGPENNAWRDDTVARYLAETSCRNLETPASCPGTGAVFNTGKFESCMDRGTKIGSTPGPYSNLQNNCQQAANCVIYACTAEACR